MRKIISIVSRGAVAGGLIGWLRWDCRVRWNELLGLVSVRLLDCGLARAR
jgi:hypothetical protein